MASEQYWDECEKAPGNDAVNAALGVLQGKAVFDGDQRELHNRVARHDGAIFYDLADERWRAVRIDERGWEVVDDPPILFRRYAHQRAQVAPARGGDLDKLLGWLSVRDADSLVLQAWLVAAFPPDIPRPILDFHGEKGSGKSTCQQVLRRLIDPSRTERLTFADNTRELVQQLAHHYAPVYENVDRLTPALSDFLCRAVTGDGFSKRELWSDDDDVIYSYRRGVMLNGINVVAQRPDALDRTILIALERIPKKERREEAEFWASYDEARPRLLGDVFDVLSEAMAIYPTVEVPNLERMADFTRWGAAVAESLGVGAGTLLDDYATNIGVQTREAVEAHIVGAAVMALMGGVDSWKGTPEELLGALELAGEAAKLLTRSAAGKVMTRGWPGAPHILSRRLNEVRSNLHQLRLTVESGQGDERWISIRRTDPEESGSGGGSDGSGGRTTPSGEDPPATPATSPPSEGIEVVLA